MIQVIFLALIVYLGTYKVIKQHGWKRAMKVAAMSFVLALGLTAGILLLVSTVFGKS